MVMGLYLLSWTTASILAAVLIYFANYYLRVPEQANYFVLVGAGHGDPLHPGLRLARAAAGQTPGLHPRRADLDGRAAGISACAPTR